MNGLLVTEGNLRQATLGSVLSTKGKNQFTKLVKTLNITTFVRRSLFEKPDKG